MATGTADRAKHSADLTEGAFTPAKAAAFSGFSRTAIYNAMASGELAFFEKDTRGRLIAKSSLVEWMRTQLRPGWC